ncbi:GTPase, G3E family [Peptoclostridium litorale DSM 5388]|uniref:CobW/P47K family protein n=1 Tax=Peptoclostridium litorale DSM 5388 TaxID=1121324 RepID=A0A069RPV2_PEPLI|nr:GTP-binding protein [Peptoclostridium litorale]KDR96202.1 CobW/P47K family protein [Peptoclostridium litorale DSM 5388]SIO13502.1 GTPase, G3E family [Peptoclostridium litorale DSM 5388]
MIKVNIISGFLGAGKTTFIKRLLSACEGQKTVLLENEFGEIGIDAEIIQREGFDVIELSSGCICCSMKMDFEKSIVEIAEKFKPDRIVIEPTGVGMLSWITPILQKESIKSSCELQSCTTIVDAVDYLENVDAFGEFFRDQISTADTVVLSKVQETDRETVRNVAKAVKILSPNATVVDEQWDDIKDIEFFGMIEGSFGKEYGKLFKMDFEMNEKESCSCGCGRYEDHSCSHEGYDRSRGHDHSHEGNCDCGCSCEGHDHEHRDSAQGLMSVSVVPRMGMSADELEKRLKALSRGGYGSVIRAKGFVSGYDSAVEFSYVNGRYSIYGDAKPGAHGLCVIGKELDEQGIVDMFKGSIE